MAVAPDLLYADLMTYLHIPKRSESVMPRLIKAQKPLRPVAIAPKRRPVKVMSPMILRPRQAS